MAFIEALTMIAIAMAVQIVAYLIMPKPKPPKPEAAKDMDSPTADQGRPPPVIFGTVWVKGINCLGYWDKGAKTYKVNA